MLRSHTLLLLCLISIFTWSDVRSSFSRWYGSGSTDLQDSVARYRKLEAKLLAPIESSPGLAGQVAPEAELKIHDGHIFWSQVQDELRLEKDNMKFLCRSEDAISDVNEHFHTFESPEIRLKSLLDSIFSSSTIDQMKLDNKLILRMIVDAIEKGSERRQRAFKELQNARGRDTLSGIVAKHMRESYEDYSRLLLRILLESAGNCRFDLAGGTVPSTWFASLVADELSVLKHRTEAIENLGLCDLEEAERQLQEATEAQIATENLRHRLFAMGFSPPGIETDRLYRRVWKTYEGAKRSHRSLLSPEDLEQRLKDLTNARQNYENQWKQRADKNRDGSPKCKPSSGFTSRKAEIIEKAIKVVEFELEAQKGLAEGDPVKAQQYLLLAEDELWDAKSDFSRLPNDLEPYLELAKQEKYRKIAYPGSYTET